MNLHLSDWLPWDRRDQLPDEPGVYVIAKGGPGKTIYIGKTWGKDGLKGRIRQFHRSASTGHDGHAGGVTYNQNIGNMVDDLFVAVHVPTVVRRDDDVLHPYIHYVERRLIWEHVEQVGRMPECNTD